MRFWSVVGTLNDQHHRGKQSIVSSSQMAYAQEIHSVGSDMPSTTTSEGASVVSPSKDDALKRGHNDATALRRGQCDATAGHSCALDDSGTF